MSTTTLEKTPKQAKNLQNTTDRSKQVEPSTSMLTKEEILQDFRICCLSREASIIARKEVLMGRANFGIIGDGKEVAQVAMARAWQKGDFRAGYYRDQTLMMSLGVSDLDAFFAQLYGDPDNDPFSGGRQMNCHFNTPFVGEDGHFLDLKNRINISADTAPTAGQVARGLGLAYASQKFRALPDICNDLSDNGNEVCFVTIGDASTSEGAFWETVNAAGVLQVPLAISVWDDGYGISVPKKYQTTKESISEVLAGFEGENGIKIYRAKGWDYATLLKMYTEAIAEMRVSHQPALFHVEEITQQLGHSTSGDHRRYKSQDRLAFEVEFDCNRQMALWMQSSGIATAAEIEAMQKAAKSEAAAAAQRAYRRYHDAVALERSELMEILAKMRSEQPAYTAALQPLYSELEQKREPFLRFEVLKVARRALQLVRGAEAGTIAPLQAFCQKETTKGHDWYSSYLMSESPLSALNVKTEPARYEADAPLKDGYEILNACFDENFAKNPLIFAFGEDVGHIGDVNQGFRGLQQKYTDTRIFDTGIREWTIMGQAIGMAMRGLRPIAEIQYLDYLLYGLAPLSDDLCTLRWRTKNQQAAPAIIRSRGHRLVGVWHAGSPMGMILGSLRGMYVCVPRNMTQAAGMYNTLLQSDDPALVIECLNGYRLKEKLPANIGTFTVPLGEVEVLRPGTDVTLVTYGSCVRVAEEAAELLAARGIEAELIDAQTLLPFDVQHKCVESLSKTNRLVVLDEDFQGGATAFILQQILETQGGYRHLDSKPLTLTAKDHRTPYGQDGDYFTKPQVEDVYDAVFELMAEADPRFM